MNTKVVKLGHPCYVSVETEQKVFEIKKPDSQICVEDICLETKDENTQNGIYLTAGSTPVKRIKFGWKVCWPEKVRFLGDAWERGYGDFEWRGMSINRVMPWYFCAEGEEKSLCFGVKVQPSAMCFWQTDSDGLTLTMDVRCGGNGVKLGGRTLHVADVVGAEISECTTFEALCEFCGQMCTEPVLPDHPVYGSNNWYYAFGRSSEEEILKDCDCILELTEGLENKPYMVIDDCWQENHRLGPNRYNGGPWTKGNSKFPDMKKLAETMKEKGVRPGIWMRPLRNEDPGIKAQWRLSHNGCLDPSHPEALAYIREDIRRICDWGYTLIKYDFSTFDLFGRYGFRMTPYVAEDGWHFYDESMTSAEVVKLLYQNIFDICQEKGVLVLGCNTIGHLGAGYMHINRIGDDTSAVDWGRVRKMGVNTLAFRLPQHRKFYDVDADCVGISGEISWNLNRQWAELLARSGTPFFASIKPGVLDEEQKKEMRGLLHIASSQSCHLVPTDWEDTDSPECWEDQALCVKRHYSWSELFQ